MTSHTTNRLSSFAPLDVFGGAANPAAAPEAESGFESALNDAAVPLRSIPAAARHDERVSALTQESRHEARHGLERNSNRLARARQKPASDVDQELAREGAANEPGPVDQDSSASSPVVQNDNSPEMAQRDPESDESQDPQSHDTSTAMVTPPIAPLIIASLPLEDEPVATEPMVFGDAKQGGDVELAFPALPEASQTVANIAVGNEELFPTAMLENSGNNPLPGSEESGAQPPGGDGAEGLVDSLTAIEQKSMAQGGDIHERKEDPSETGPQEPALDALGTADYQPIPTMTDSAAVQALPPVTPIDQGALPRKDRESSPEGNSKTPPDVNAARATHRLPEHVVSRSEGERGHAPAIPVDSARFLSRVAKAFIAAQQRDGEIRLRLSPPELGSLRLQVSVQEGVMMARLETETEAARSSLVNHLPALRERLEQQGIRVERFDIDLMQRPSTGTPDRPSDPQQRDEMPHLRSPRVSTAAGEPVATSSSANSWNGQGRLNVII